MYSPIDILDAREQRVQNQKKLLKKYKNTLIVVRANYPGINKCNETTKGIVNEIKEELLRNLKLNSIKIIFFDYKCTPEGPLFFAIVDMNFVEIKKMCINIEEKHSLGRFVDIDVYNENGEGISRSDLKIESRKCFICSNNAHICVRSRKHGIEEIINYIETNFKNYKEQKNE